MIRKHSIILIVAISWHVASEAHATLQDPLINQLNIPILPIIFERNVGQRKDDTEFISRTQAGIVLLKRGSVFILPKQWHRPIKISFEKSSTSIGKGRNCLSARINYFKGKDQTLWLQDIPAFRTVHYDDIYPGINVDFYGNDNQLEYDLTIRPGTKDYSIIFKIENAKQLRLTDGDLIIVGDGKELIHHAPVAYQFLSGHRIHVDAKYEIVSGHRVRIALGKYDRKKELVIDPSITYSTYLGGTGWDQATDLIADPSGNPIVYGQTSSVDFPLMGPIDPNLGGSQDLFIAKFDNDASDLIFATYLGGSSFDYSARISTDAAGSLYLTGLTFSDDFPVTPGVFDNTFNSGICGQPDQPCSDGFITKLDTSGSSLIFSTYLGGDSKSDGVDDIALDSIGDIYAVGSTTSLDFPVTTGAFQTVHGDSGTGVSESDGFITKLDSMASNLVYSSFIGSVGSDFARAVVVDASNNAYIVGDTASFTFPTVTPFQAENSCEDELPQFIGNPFDAFVSKVEPTGSSLLFSTYLGGCGGGPFEGAGEDRALDVAFGTDGNLYVTGSTTSRDPEPFPTTITAYDAGHVLSGTFLTKMDVLGSTLLYSTTLGESQTYAQSIALRDLGIAYVAGKTVSSLLDVRDPIQASYAGAQDGFIAKFDTNASGDNSLLMLTYLGGTGQDDIRSMFGDGSDIYITGQTSSTDYPTTPGVFQEGFQTAPPLFDETFNDPIMGWELKGTWNQDNGDLIVTTSSRATAFSPFAGCNDCTVEAEMLLENENGKAFLIGWKPNKKDQIIVTLKNIDTDSGKVILKQKAGGGTVFKSKQNYPIIPGQIYDVKVTVNGTNIIVLVDNVELFNVNSTVDPKDTGDFGFKARGIGGGAQSYRFGRLLISAAASDPGSAIVTKIAD